MGRTGNESVWTDLGYKIFADEGPDGMQIERLARILNLNKSSFYHYFSNLDNFYNKLLKLHKKNADLFIADIQEIKTIDPEYLQVLEKYALPVLFQMKLIKSKPNSEFYKIAESIDQKVILILRDVWADYLGFQDQPELAMRYYSIVRDMLYTRVNSSNINYAALQGLMKEAKDVMQQIGENKSALEADDFLK